MSNQTGGKKAFYYWLDPIRFLAAVLVLLVHARGVMFVYYADLVPTSHNFIVQLFYLLGSLGGVSVGVFFILSGFLLGGQTLIGMRAGKISLKKFVLDRIFRIGVPLTGALVLIVAVNYIIDKPINVIQLLGQYTGLQGVLFWDYGGVFWTLPYEIWFYVFLMVVIMVFKKVNPVVSMTFLCITLIVFSQLTSLWLFVILLGVVSFVIKDLKITEGLKTMCWILLTVSLLVYVLCGANYIQELCQQKTLFSMLSKLVSLIFFAIAALLISQYSTQKPTRRISIWINKWGKKASVFSYSLYLTHYQVLKLWLAYGKKMDDFNLETVSIFIGYCFLCVAVAYGFYWIFERNSKNIQRKVENALGIHY